MAMPFLLSLYYSYAIDYQPQGRYILPMLIPFSYYCIRGLYKAVSAGAHFCSKFFARQTDTPAEKLFFNRLSTGVCLVVGVLILLSVFITVYGYAFPYYELHPTAP